MQICKLWVSLAQITSLAYSLEQPKPSHSARLALQNPICSEPHFGDFSLSDFPIGNLAIYDGDPHTNNWSLSGAHNHNLTLCESHSRCNLAR